MTSFKRARIRSLREIVPRVFELEADMEEPAEIHYRPGEYVSVRIYGGDEQRSFSIASEVGRQDGFTLLIRRIGGTESQFLGGLRVGDLLEFEGPRGEFSLHPAHPGDAVFAATGVGVAPLFPMMEALLARRERGRVRFLWGLNDEQDVFWNERLRRLQADPRFSSTVVFTAQGQGFVTEHVIQTVGQLDAPVYYLCGNGQMVRDVMDGLQLRGIDRRQIRTDWY